jgi:23S rRNA (uracil1939-C5)-methyltransferase
MASDLLKIETVVAGGDGMARHPDGYVVFVPRTAPGETVEVEYTEVHKQWRRARVLQNPEPSPKRRTPPCPHYDHCGGCQLQHVDYDTQLEAKASIVADALRRIGKLDVDTIEVEGSPKELEYRNRVSFIVLRASTDHVAGLHALGSAERVLDIDACPLAEPPINSAWQSLRAGWGPGALLLPAGEELRLTLRATADGAVGLAIEKATEPGEPQRLLELSAHLASVWTLGDRGNMTGWAGEKTLNEQWLGRDLPLAGTAFVQVNRYVAERIDAYVLEQCSDLGGQRLVDAYCGYGVRSLEASRVGADVVGIDFDRHAVRAARSLAKEAELSARFVTSRVEAAIDKELPAEVVILNPPRRGLEKRVVTALLHNPPARIVYVSCDPATLSRDLRALSSLYDVTTIRAFDLFPQTAHVETAATLARNA